ncbi:pyridoxine/pyridoxal/pyridoxamine kinase [Atlantibacter hermannii]|nr:pyridoxine/pyridoxal/pyridoxamine kinase [Atlantibacter hermannii]NBC99995.1 pyridoxine/pyridoxal/pyridoxamine kinase [Atlantibacter hermannii]
MTAILFGDGQRALRTDIISVQSQVVYGSVGNSIAIPTLQQAGFRAMAVPTVLLSNTPHYPSLYGGAIPDDWFKGYLTGLLERDAVRHVKGIITGYLGSVGQANILADWLARVRERYPHLWVIIDPVMGDTDSGIYVKQELPQAYSERLLPLATGITPNAFELERLTGRASLTLAQAVDAARTLLNGHTQWVAVTSAPGDDVPPDRMQVALVTADTVEVVVHPRVNAELKGTGDLFCSALAGKLLQGATLAEAVKGASERVVDVMRHTLALGFDELALPEHP